MRKLLLVLLIAIPLMSARSPESMTRMDWYTNEVYQTTSYVFSSREQVDLEYQYCLNPYTKYAWYTWWEADECWLFVQWIYFDETTE